MPVFDGTTDPLHACAGRTDAPVVALCAGFVCPDTYWKYLVPALETRPPRRSCGTTAGSACPGSRAIPASTRDAIDDEELVDRGERPRPRRGPRRRRRSTTRRCVGHSMGVPGRPRGATGGVRSAYRASSRSPARTGRRYAPSTGRTSAARLAPFALPLVHLLPRVTLLAWRALLSSPLVLSRRRPRRCARSARARSPRTCSGYFEHLSTLDPLIVAKMVRGMHNHDADGPAREDRRPGADRPRHDATRSRRSTVAEDMEREIPNAKLVVIEGAAHTLPIEYPSEVAGRGAGFLDDRSAAS